MDIVLEYLQQRALNNAIKVLENLKCQFAIISPDNKKYGELEVVAPANQHKRGEVRAYVKEKLNGFLPEPGELGFINCDEGIDLEAVRCSLLNWCIAEHGPQSMTTEVDHEKRQVKYYRAL